MKSESELLLFGREVRSKCAEAMKKEACWKGLQLAREEWRSWHPNPQRYTRKPT